jgi:hypothetical protein
MLLEVHAIAQGAALEARYCPFFLVRAPLWLPGLGVGVKLLGTERAMVLEKRPREEVARALWPLCAFQGHRGKRRQRRRLLREREALLQGLARSEVVPGPRIPQSGEQQTQLQVPIQPPVQVPAQTHMPLQV